MSQSGGKQELLHHMLLMAEVGIELKERFLLAERSLSQLKSLVGQATKTVLSLQGASRSSLQNARRLLLVSPPAAGSDQERLLNLVERHLGDFDSDLPAELEVTGGSACEISLTNERIRSLENKLKTSSDNCLQTGSNKSLKCDVDEKYPENWSRDSSIDLNNVVNLPPVPEDVFSSFTSGNKPRRSSSLSSLKSMRKVKLFLQRAETSASDEDEASSDAEEHENIGQKGDSDDSSPVKKLLGNIKEESQDM